MTMPNPLSLNRPAKVALCALTLALTTPLFAQTLTWDGATNNNWSNSPGDVNWTGNPWSAGADAVFSPGTFTVDLTAPITADNLLLNNSGTSGVSLTLTGNNSLTIDGNAPLSLGPFQTGNNGASSIGATTLDMSGLDAFTFDSPSQVFRVGLQPGTQGAYAAGTTVSTVTLADTNSITASQLLMGDTTANSGGGRSVLQLGRANTINANTISISATGRTNALLQFDPSVSGASATFRATDGSSPVANWNIGAVRTFNNTVWAPVVDLSGGSIDAIVTTMTIGDANTANQGNRAGTSDATFTMGAGTFNVSTLNIGRVTGSNSIHPTNPFRGAGLFNVDDPNAQFTAGTILLATMNHTASGGSNISTRGEFNLESGTATITGGVVLGSNTTTGNPGTVDAVLRQNAGTLSITGGLLEGSEASGAVNSNVQLLGGTSTIAGGITTDTIRVGFNGRSATATATGGSISIGDGTSTALIGHKITSGSTTSGTLDLQAASSVTMDLASLRIAHNNQTSGQNGATVLGTLELSTSGPNTITADLIRIGDIDGGSTGNTTGTLALGANNTINVDTFVVGGDKATGFVSIPTSGTLTLAGKSGPAADLLIGANNAGATSTNPAASHFDMGSPFGTNTTLNATLDNLVIGQYTGTGSGSGKGILTMNGGTVTVNNILLADSNGSNPQNTTGQINVNTGSISVAGGITDGAGTSTISFNGNLSGGTGTLTVGNGLQVDNLRVGFNGRTAVTTVQGGAVRLGDGSGSNSYVGYRFNTGSTTNGSLDLSAASSVTVDTGTLGIAFNESNSNGGAAVLGTLQLSSSGPNVITADTFLLGQINGGSTGNTFGTVELGLDNTINADTLVVGADKGRGLMVLPSGGSLTIAGKTGPAAQVRVGSNNGGNTGTNPTASHLNLADGTVDAAIDTLQIGTYIGTAGGSGKGIVTMGAGTINANAITLATTNGSNPANTQGTFNLNGGNLTAGSITRGDGTAAFNFNSGTLAFQTFGSGPQPFSLANTGTGILNPGVNTSGPAAAVQLFGTAELFGSYTQGPDAALHIDLDGIGNHDSLIVHEDVTLDGALSLNPSGPYLYSPGEITLIDNLGQSPVSGTFAGLAEGAFVGPLDFGGTLVDFYRISYAGGDGNNVVLFVPEPARALLLLIASASLLLRRRR